MKIRGKKNTLFYHPVCIFMKLFTVESRLRNYREIPNSFTMFIGLKIRSLSNRTASHMVKSWGRRRRWGRG